MFRQFCENIVRLPRPVLRFYRAPKSQCRDPLRLGWRVGNCTDQQLSILRVAKSRFQQKRAGPYVLHRDGVPPDSLHAREERFLGGARHKVSLHSAKILTQFDATAWVQRRICDQCRLDPFDDAEIAFCTRAECLKGLSVSLALVGGQRNFVTVKFYDDSSLLQACFVRVDFYRRSSQKTSTK